MSGSDLSPEARAEVAAGLMIELAALDEARAALDAQRATKLAALRRLNGGPVPSEVRAAPRRMLTLKQAAHSVDRHPDTIRAWCKRYGIGWREVGQWRVDFDRMVALLASRNVEDLSSS